ncbi:ribosome maturation factor RimM [Gilliamella sp. wkB112]|uniref:ribosome maturation factor RimM n=1 Tax=Gilliamella sp. wkB112 TaxID=3120257 RepID=UPI00210020DC|nr:ribosome maturation factor RimM [Gilliamella apicola]
MNTENLIVVGKLGSSYGIRGWLRVFSFTEIPDSIFDYTPWYIQRAGQWQEVIVESFKPHNQDMIVKLTGIDDRDQANALTNAEVYVDAQKLPQLDNGDFYWKDLIGCQVKTISGYNLGQVTDLMETGSNDVLVVKANLKDAFGATERLIPFVEEQFIKQVDLTTKMIVVDWDPGF